MLTHDLAGLDTKTVRVEGRSIRIVALDDLIEIKLQSGRPQDKEDVRALRALKGRR